MQFSWFAFYDANALVGCSRPFLYLLSIVLLFLSPVLWIYIMAVDVERVQNASRKKITLRFKQESENNFSRVKGWNLSDLRCRFLTPCLGSLKWFDRHVFTISRLGLVSVSIRKILIRCCDLRLLSPLCIQQNKKGKRLLSVGHHLAH